MALSFRLLESIRLMVGFGSGRDVPVASRIRLVSPVDLLDGALLELPAERKAAPADGVRGLHLMRQGTSVR